MVCKSSVETCQTCCGVLKRICSLPAFKKCFECDGNVFHDLIQVMFNFTRSMPQRKDISKESGKTYEKSFYMLKTIFAYNTCHHLFLCITFSTLRKTLLTLSFHLFFFNLFRVRRSFT